MDNKPAVFIRVMQEALLGIDLTSLSHLKIGTEWAEVQILTDPFVVFRKDRYQPVVLVEELETELKYLLFVSAKSLDERLEPLRVRRGALVG